jgi:hypothetical protein
MAFIISTGRETGGPSGTSLVIDHKTAKAFGLDVPDKLLAVADEVTE